MSRWFEALADCQRRGIGHVQAQVVSAAGSTPREPGAQMVITATAHFDTLGGGRFEQQVIDAARRLSSRARAGSGCATVALESFALGARAGQCCGGHISVLLSCYPPAGCRLALFGAGHVGQAVAAQARLLGWPLAWFDSREHPEPPLAQSAGFESAIEGDLQTGCDTRAAVPGLPPGVHALVMTHDHGEDQALIEALLERQRRQDDLASIGLIGSSTKWARFRHRLREAGFEEALIDRVRCPVGLSHIPGKRPEEIALAIAAELQGMTPDGENALLRGLDGPTLKTLGEHHDLVSPGPTAEAGRPTSDQQGF